MTDLLSQMVTTDTALTLHTIDYGYHVYYPLPQGGMMTFGDLVQWMERTIKAGGLLRVGDPSRVSDLCSITWVNAAHIVSFEKAGGHR